MKIAVCPGSFDPVTYGHLDIIRRASKMFDKVIVVVMTNYAKKDHKHSFSVEERVGFLARCTAEMKNVEVDSYGGLLADYTRKKGAVVIVKGLRAVSDFENEFQQALTNMKLNPGVETIFMTTSAENMFLSSSVVRQICELGGDITDFVPPVIHDDIVKRLQGKGEQK